MDNLKELIKSKFAAEIKGDKIIWAVAVFLAIVAMLAVYSATGTLAFKKGGSTLHYLFRHGIFVVAGFFVMWLVQRVQGKVLIKWLNILSPFLVYASVPLLLFTLVSGASLNSASRWISIMGFTFQTSDFVKPALIIYVSTMLANIKNASNEVEMRKQFWIMIGWIAIICALIMPANLSTAVMLYAICLLLIFIGEVKMELVMKLLGLTAAAGVLVLLLIFFGPQVGRVATWKARIERFVSNDPNAHDAEENFQADRAKMAVVGGSLVVSGPFGRGPGNSIQRHSLPHPYSDFIYAIIIEEYGLLGGLLVMFAYFTLFFRAIKCAIKCSSMFPQMMVIGLALSMLIQALFNMGVAAGAFPVTGQTLPFVSMGGTSILFVSVMFGLILNITVNGDIPIETAKKAK